MSITYEAPDLPRSGGRIQGPAEVAFRDGTRQWGYVTLGESFIHFRPPHGATRTYPLWVVTGITWRHGCVGAAQPNEPTGV